MSSAQQLQEIVVTVARIQERLDLVMEVVLAARNHLEHDDDASFRRLERALEVLDGER